LVDIEIDVADMADILILTADIDDIDTKNYWPISITMPRF